MLNEDHLGSLAEESTRFSAERKRSPTGAVRLVLGWRPPKRLGRAPYWLFVLSIILVGYLGPWGLRIAVSDLGLPSVVAYAMGLVVLVVYTMSPAVLTYTILLRCRETDSPICGLIGVLAAVLLWANLMLYWMGFLLPWVTLDVLDFFLDILGDNFLLVGLPATWILTVLGVIIVGAWPPARGQGRDVT